MLRRFVTVIFLLASPALAMLQTAEPKDAEINGMLAGKKPCDEDKKKAEASPLPTPTPVAQAAHAQNQEKAVQGLMNLGVIPADKQEPAKKSLGALPGPMENCK